MVVLRVGVEPRAALNFGHQVLRTGPFQCDPFQTAAYSVTEVLASYCSAMADI